MLYECPECGRDYVPDDLAMLTGRARAIYGDPWCPSCAAADRWDNP